MSKQAWFTRNVGTDFKDAVEADDYLHTEACAANPHPNTTETQFFGFSIPEERIHSINYFRHHPNMKHMLGGALVFQGMKLQFPAAELADYRIYLKDEPLANDTHSVTLPNGYHSEVIEPLKSHRISYRDEARGNAFEIYYEAVMPPANLAQTGHFEQAMHATGELLLRGKRYDVDCITIRNRSWGEGRDEAPAAIPAAAWMSCNFGPDFAFNCNAIDHPDLDPVWKGKMEFPAEKTLLGGWVWRDGEIIPLATVRKITRYDRYTMVPESFECLMTDERGHEYRVTGRIVAVCPYNVYLNIQALMCLAEIECNGRKGYCDFQDLQFTDFLNAAYGRDA